MRERRESSEPAEEYRRKVEEQKDGSTKSDRTPVRYSNAARRTECRWT